MIPSSSTAISQGSISTISTTMVTRRRSSSISNNKSEDNVPNLSDPPQDHSDRTSSAIIVANTTPSWLRDRLHHRHKRRMQIYHLTRGYKRLRHQQENQQIETICIQKQQQKKELKEDMDMSTELALLCHNCKGRHYGTRDILVQHLTKCFMIELPKNVDDTKGDFELPNTWMCEMCQRTIFSDYEEACEHEKSCNGQVLPEKVSSSGEVHNKKIDGEEFGKDFISTNDDKIPDIPSLDTWLQLPDSILNRLSSHNSLLLQSIEFFQVTADDIKHRTYRDEIRQGQIGLRCISCAEVGRVHGTHTRAAYCFPGSIRSIASGMATISRRHYTADKCNTIDKKQLYQLKVTKSATTSNASNGTEGKGRYGLETLCKDIARKYFLMEHNSGLFFERDFSGVSSIGDYPSPNTIEPKLNFAYQVLEDNLRQWKQIQEVSEVQKQCQYQPTAQPFFWECKACKSIPYQWRASGSVLFSMTNTSDSCEINAKDDISTAIQRHGLLCQGSAMAQIPRVALSQIEALSSNNGNACVRRDSSSKGKLDTSILIPPERATPEEQLVQESDKDLVPDYVYFTMLQLRSCKLQPDAVGGSRAEMPAGYPGLACRFCYKASNGRRFFYSSPLKLWNSFGNIASHILEHCTTCPNDVRVALENLKQQRGKTRARGSQKKFMELVWNRLHKHQYANANTSSDSSVTKRVSIAQNNTEETRDAEDDHDLTIYTCGHDSTREKTDDHANAVGVENGDENTEFYRNEAERDCQMATIMDKPFATDFTYLVMHHMVKCRLDASDHGRRNLFPVGFGGLECKYCAPYPSSRKFFYRTVDVLAGNFAQIPNHLLGCKFVPENIKFELVEAKKSHAAQKNKFLHGSQREFLSRVWKRIHS